MANILQNSQPDVEPVDLDRVHASSDIFDIYNYLNTLKQKTETPSMPSIDAPKIGSTINDYSGLYSILGAAGDMVNTAANDNIAMNASNNAVLGNSVSGNTWGDIISSNTKLAQGLQNINSSTPDISNVKNNFNLENVFNTNVIPDYIKSPSTKDGIASTVGAVIGDTGKGAAIGSMFGPVGTIVGGGIGALSGIVRSGIGNAQNQRNRNLMNANINRQFDSYIQDYNDTVAMNDARQNRTNKYNIFQQGGFMPEGNGVTTFSGLKHGQFGLNGIPQGIASDGLPNYVEGGGFDKNGNPLKGEIKYKDYIYSARNKVSKSLLNKYNLPEKYADKPFAEVAEQLQKESENRPNDPISKRTLDDMMSRLANAQEEYNYKKEMRRLSKDLSNLQQQQNQFAFMQSPQQIQTDSYAQQEMPVDAFNMPSDTQYADGGSIHIKPSKRGTFTAAATKHGKSVQAFASQVLANPDNYSEVMRKKAQFAKNASHWHSDGGHIYQNGTSNTDVIKRAIAKVLGVNTTSELQDLLDSNVDIDSIDWNNIKNNEAIMKALQSKNPALYHAINAGYDFGNYTLTDGLKYNFDDLFKRTNESSRQAGNSATTYKIDKKLSREQVKALENTPEYQRFTDYILNNATDDERLKYFQWLDNNTGYNNKSKYIQNGKLRDDWKNRYQNYRTEHKYGIQHYTPELLNRNKLIKNYIKNDNGEWEELLTEPNKSWTSENFSWQTPDSDILYNYYTAPNGNTEQSITNSSNPIFGNINDNITRKTGLIGSGLSSALAFATPPDMTYANYLNSLAGQYNYIAPTLLGRERENDLDVNLANNQMLAQNAASQRSIRDNNNRWNQTAASLAQQQQMFNSNALFNVGAQQAQQADDLAVHKLNYDLDSKDQDTIRAYDLANLDTNTRRINMLQNSAQAADNATTLASTNRSQSLTNFLNNLSALGKENIQFGLVNKAIEDKAIQGFPYLYSNWLGNTYSV